MVFIKKTKEQAKVIAEKNGISLALLEDSTRSGRSECIRVLTTLKMKGSAKSHDITSMLQYLHATHTVSLYAKMLSADLKIVGIDCRLRGSAKKMQANYHKTFDARNKRMIKGLLELQGQHVLCVVGAAHVLPIAAGLKNLVWHTLLLQTHCPRKSWHYRRSSYVR